MLASRLTRKARINDALVERVAHFVAWALVGYLYFRFWDAFAQHYTYGPGRTEGFELLTSGPLSFNFWVLEMLLGTLVPMVMLLTPYTRQQSFLEDGCPGPGRHRRDRLSLGHQSVRLAGGHVVPARSAVRGLRRPTRPRLLKS